MNHKHIFTGAVSAALLLMIATPAAAMDKSRARDAIAEADADIQAAWLRAPRTRRRMCTARR